MTLAIVADPHVWPHRAFGGPVVAGVNNRARAVLDTLDRALDVAAAHDEEWFVVAGDMFDGVLPTPQLVAAAQDVLWKARGKDGDGPHVKILAGNHDRVSVAPGDHALGPLNPVADLIDRPQRHRPLPSTDMWFVPHVPGPMLPYLESAASGFAADDPAGVGGLRTRRVLVAHLGIVDGRTPPHLVAQEDAIHVDALFDFMEKFDIGLLAAGHWHQHRSWERGGRRIIQIGALCPRDFRDGGITGYGKLLLVNMDAHAGIEVDVRDIPGDRFVVVHSEKEEAAAVKGLPAGCHLHLRRTYETNAPVPAGVRVESAPDLAGATAATRSAALAARGAGTLDEALAAYVAEMPLEEGVDRAAVHARCREFLRTVEG